MTGQMENVNVDELTAKENISPNIVFEQDGNELRTGDNKRFNEMSGTSTNESCSEFMNGTDAGGDTSKDEPTKLRMKKRRYIIPNLSPPPKKHKVTWKDEEEDRISKITTLL